jgi:transposase-like protein
MGQILHKCATTTYRIRTEIQQSKESVSVLAKKFGINIKTVYKWKKRGAIIDAPMGAKKLRTVLTEIEELAICTFRTKTQLALDDCYIALKDSIPTLTRSNLHRCLKRHGISVLPKDDDQSKRSTFKKYEIGYFHIDICQVATAEGKVYLYVAIDRTSKYVYAEIHDNQTMHNAQAFLNNLVSSVPYKIHKVLTDNGAQFTYKLLLPELRPTKEHLFDTACASHGIEHRLTKFRHPWTNGQAERMNRTIKDYTIKKYYYDTIKQLAEHLHDFLMAYNFSKKLKSLKFLTPYEKIVKTWDENKSLFKSNPYHYLMGLNTYQTEISFLETIYRLIDVFDAW